MYLVKDAIKLHITSCASLTFFFLYVRVNFLEEHVDEHDLRRVERVENQLNHMPNFCSLTL